MGMAANPISVKVTDSICTATFDADEWWGMCELDRANIIGALSAKFKDQSEHLVIWLDQPDLLLGKHQGGMIYRERIQPKKQKRCPTCGGTVNDRD